MAVEVETFVFKAELDSKEAARNSKRLEDKLRSLQDVEKTLAKQSHQLKEEIVKLSREELKGGETAKAAAAKRRAAQVALREERLEAEKLRREIAELRQEEAREARQARETAAAHDRLARATSRAEQAAAREAARSASIIEREAGRAERARERSARAEVRIKANNAKDIEISRKINARENAIAELDQRLMELTSMSPGQRLARGVKRRAAGLAEKMTPEALGDFTGRSASQFVRGVPGAAMGVLGGAAKVGAAGGAAVAGIGSVGSKYESLRAGLTTALGGSAAEGDKAFEQIKRFAKETPYAVEEVTRAVTMLKVRGLEPTVEASMEALRTYGDVAGAMGKDLPTVIEAVSDAATGEMERLKEAFNVVGHKAGDELKLTFNGVTTTIKNNSTEITNYLKNIGKVNFAGGMARQAATLGGAWSNLGDAVMNFADEIYRNGLGDALKEVLGDMSENISGSETLAEVIGQKLGEAVREVYGFFKELLGPTSELPDKFQKAWEIGSKLADGVGALIKVLASLGELLGPTGIALVAFGAAATSALGPIGLLITAGVGLGMAFDSVTNSITDSIGAVDRFKEKQDKLRQEDEWRKQMGELNEANRRRDITNKEGSRVWEAGKKAREDFVAARLRRLGKNSIDDLDLESRKALEREAGAIERGVRGDVNALHGEGAGAKAEKAGSMAVAGEVRGADWAEFNRLKTERRSGKLAPSKDKRFKELAKQFDQPVDTKKGKRHLTAAEQEQKKRIDDAVEQAELRAADEARLTGRGADALKLAKAAGKETRDRLEGMAKRGDALPHEIDTAFERIAGYENMAGAPPPPVVMKNYNTTITITAPLEAKGFDGSPQEFGTIAIQHIVRGLEETAFPAAKRQLETDLLR